MEPQWRIQAPGTRAPPPPPLSPSSPPPLLPLLPFRSSNYTFIALLIALRTKNAMDRSGHNMATQFDRILKLWMCLANNLLVVQITHTVQLFE